MTLDEIITKCNIGEEHLTQEEYEQVGRWLAEYRALREEYDELDEAHGKLFVEYSRLRRGLKIAYEVFNLYTEDGYKKAREE